MLFQIGVGFCMAWIMVRDTSVPGTVMMSDPRNVAATGANEEEDGWYRYNVYNPKDVWKMADVP